MGEVFKLNHCYNMDCLPAMELFPDNYFDLAVVDPPYFSGPERRGFYGSKVSKIGVHRDYPVSPAWSKPEPEYFKELFRVCRHYIVWGCNYFDYQFSTGRIVWDKCNGNSSFSDCEIAATNLFSSVRMFRYMWSGMMQGKSITEGDTMQGNKSLNEKRIHPTQKPVALYDWIFKNYAEPGQKILDTHLGSGSSRIAAYEAGLTKVNGVATSGPKVIQAGEKGSPDWIVRRLIPLECGRLQGFPDGWAEIAPLTSPQEFPFWREVYARDCEIKGKRPSRKIVQGGSTESDKALMRWHDGLHSMAAEYAMWGNGMSLPNALFFVKNAFRELGKPAENVKLGSLFDGSGTMPLCAVMCGGRAVWASEVEPYPIAVTRTHLPHMKHLGSVKDVRGDKIEPVDIITFGSPCQDLSIAGKRAGLGGGRSGLFWEAIRIIIEMLVATNGKYPRFVIWENVPGALSSNGGKDFETVLNELLRIRGFAGGRADKPILQHGKWGGLRKLRSCCLSNRQCSILGNPPAQAQSICCLRYS